MSAIVGTVLVLASILIFGWSIVAFRNPNGPAWRNKYLALESVACVIVAAFTFGVALQLQFALAAEGVMAAALSVGVVVFLVVAFVAVWRILGVKSKIAQLEAAGAEDAGAHVRFAAKRA